MNDRFTTFLFAMPSAMEGVARIFDIGGSLNEYNRSQDPDRLALTMDYLAVANDIRSAALIVDRREEVEKDQAPQPA